MNSIKGKKNYIRVNHDEVPLSNQNKLIKEEVLKLIYERLEKLPTLPKRVFKMFFLEKLSIKEIASELKITEDDVTKNKTIAVKLLKIKMFEDEK